MCIPKLWIALVHSAIVSRFAPKFIMFHGLYFEFQLSKLSWWTPCTITNRAPAL